MTDPASTPTTTGRRQPQVAANPIPYWSRDGKTREVFATAFADFQEIGFTAVKADVPEGIQILFGETGDDHPFVEHEQMMPFVPFVRVPDVDRAIELAQRSEHGYGHTAMLHSRDTAVMSRMGKGKYGIRSPLEFSQASL